MIKSQTTEISSWAMQVLVIRQKHYNNVYILKKIGKTL